MLLPELIADQAHLPKIEITGLTADSRAVRAGFLFAAFPGAKQDGRAFITDAIKQGAVAILAPEGTNAPNNTPLITDKNPRRRFAQIAATFFGQQVGTTVAVTGTNGKSSTVHFCREIWKHLGLRAASLGTIGIIGPDFEKTGALTTPDPVSLHADIADLATRGISHLAMEASSQGLDQYRLDGVEIKAAAFTNLTRDHLDYHGTMENYFAAKMRLFSEVMAKDGIAVINANTPYSKAVFDVCKKRGIRTVGFGQQAEEITLLDQKPLPHGQFVSLRIFGERHDLELSLVGAFQTENVLSALGLVLAEKIDDKKYLQQAIAALPPLGSVRGRLELAARLPNGAAVYVDYAHTPDGLETMLTSIRPHAQKKLHVVFGCGGDRDRGKRPMMGKIAVTLADHVIVTDDNPRTENADAIRAEIMAAATGATEIAGRRDAIRAAVQNLQAGDILVIAGKGHEQGQIVGKEIFPFDDVTEAKEAIKELSK